MLIPLTEITDQITLEFTDLNEKELNLTIGKYYSNLKIARTKINLIKKALGISADFNVRFTVTLVCARCLATFKKEFNETLHLDYITGKDPLLSLEKVELKPGDIDRVYYNGPNLDTSIGIREAIILAIPSAPLCKEECQGLCPVCGKNLNKEKCNCQIQKFGFFTPQTKVKK